MKKVTTKLLQTALLRGAVAVSGSTATAVTALFIKNIYGVLTTLFLGAAIVVLIDEVIINSLNNR